MPGAGGVGAEAVSAAGAGPVSVGVNDGLRSLLVAGATSSALGDEAAESVFFSPEVMVCRLPCRPLPCPLSEPEEPEGRAFALPMISAGSGTVVLAPVSVVSSAAVPAATAESRLTRWTHWNR